MKYRFLILFIFLLIVSLSLSGCAQVKEIAKVMWGSSTKALEEARMDALRKKYQCSFEECFDAVLTIVKKTELTIFINNKERRFLVLIHIPGNTDTTEVGIFFSETERRNVRIEISSLSFKAQETAANIIFSYLAEIFEES